MKAYFGESASLEGVTAEQCHKYKAELLRKHSQGYTAKQIERGRNLFTAAVNRKLLTENPFATVIAGRHHNPDKMYFASAEETQALLDACNSPKQRLIIALARWGGLRCPSELVGLKWSEVNWERNRFIVHSPKTEGQGKSQRTVPIFKELYPFLREAIEAAPEGIDRVYPEFTEKKSLGSFIEKLATRAGIVLWIKPFQNMRSSRATELIEIFPAHIVNAWMGHTEAVAMAHYRQTGKAADKFFDQAAGAGEIPTEKKGGNSVGEHAGMACPEYEVGLLDIYASSGISTACNDMRNPLQGKDLGQVAGAGLERIAPNLLLLLVLQECPPDVPTLFPTFSGKITPLDCALAPDLQRSGGDVASPHATPTPPYNDEDTVSLSIPKPVAVISDGTTTERILYDKKEG
jgi:integrase